VIVRQAPSSFITPTAAAQYRSLALGNSLRHFIIVASTSSRGDTYDAATARVMSTIEIELVRRHTLETRDQARLAVFSYIEGSYSPQRRHSALGYWSPVEFEEKMGEEQAAVSIAS
jgi:putative transposase